MPCSRPFPVAPPSSACVMSSSIPGCLPLPDFIREEVWKPELLGRMARPGRGRGGGWGECPGSGAKGAEGDLAGTLGGEPSGTEMEQEGRDGWGEKGIQSFLPSSFICKYSNAAMEKKPPPGGDRKPEKDVKTENEK